MTFILEDGIPILERTPATFHAMLAGLPSSWISANEGPDTFSPVDDAVGPWRRYLPVMDR